MAIYGIGAYYGDRGDVSGDFISAGIAGPGWDDTDAPELHQFIRSLRVGDIVYLKSAPASSSDLFIKAIGIVRDEEIVPKNELVAIGRNIHWLSTKQFQIPRPTEKNNVRSNTMYEEFHPQVQVAILREIF
jgi:hypothetical protein